MLDGQIDSSQQVDPNAGITDKDGRAPKFRNWFFTWNNPDLSLKEVESKARKINAKCFIGQAEIGEKGNYHYQFFIGYKSAHHWKSVREHWPHAAIFRSNSPVDSWAYCSKEDTRVEGSTVHSFGEPPIKRNSKCDMRRHNQLAITKGAVYMVDEGLINIKDMYALNRSVNLYKLQKTSHENISELTNEWHVGPSGCGKSSTVRATFPDFFNKPLNKWWDGYQEEPTVLLDDFGPEHSCLSGYLKHWADHYVFQGETKGGTVSLRPCRIIVTS